MLTTGYVLVGPSYLLMHDCCLFQGSSPTQPNNNPPKATCCSPGYQSNFIPNTKVHPTHFTSVLKQQKYSTGTYSSMDPSFRGSHLPFPPPPPPCFFSFL